MGDCCSSIPQIPFGSGSGGSIDIVMQLVTQIDPDDDTSPFNGVVDENGDPIYTRVKST